MSDDWSFAETDPADELTRLHLFSVKKPHADGTVEFRITVRERVAQKEDRTMRFFAQADKQTNQRSAPFTPSGWGDTMLKALRECVEAVHRFPYEPTE